MQPLLGREELATILRRYFVQGDRSPDVVAPDMPPADVDPAVIDELLARPDLHDADYRVFGHFRDPRSTILDVGANFGYSATSIWRAGAAAAVVSFEPIPTYAPVLAALGDRLNRPSRRGWLDRWRRRKRHEFHNVGISDEEGVLEFHLPVLNGDRINSALTTAYGSPDIESYVENTLFFARANGIDIRSLRMHAFRARVTTLDSWVSSRVSKVDLRNIVAVKIDTEGYEGHVLAGAQTLLRRHRPLVMAECGHSIPLVGDIMRRHGYVALQRDGDRLAICESPSGVNAFFGHVQHFASYRAIGLMA